MGHPLTSAAAGEFQWVVASLISSSHFQMHWEGLGSPGPLWTAPQPSSSPFLRNNSGFCPQRLHLSLSRRMSESLFPSHVIATGTFIK